MHVGTAVERIDTLAPHELRRLRGLIEQEITNYRRASANYTPEKFEKFAKPYLAERAGWLRRIDVKLEGVKS